MSIDMFKTRTMLEALEQMFIPKTFILDTFFKNVETSTTKTVDIDIIKGKRRLAPFVQPTAQGKIVERTGFTTQAFEPPYIKQKMPTKATEILNRLAGNTIYQGNSSPSEQAAKQLGKDLVELIQMIVRREEWMGANALDTGIITVSGEGINATIDFKMAASHKITLTGTALWTDALGTPIKNLRTWKRLVAQDSGLTPDAAIFGSSVIDAFLANADVQKLLDNRRILLGQIDPKTLPNGATYIGRIEELDIYGYDEWYLDDAGVLQPMVPVDKVWLGSTRARTARHYGAIQDLEANLTGAVQYFPKSWIEKDPSVQWLMVQSAPLVCPHEIDAFLSAKAV